MRVCIFDHMEECTEKAVQAMMPMVSDQRRAQAGRYVHTFGRFCCLKSWLMLQEEMKSYGFRLSTFGYSESGKPFLSSGPYFSISHCKTGIAVAIDDQPVGIDIESVRKVDPELVTRTMNDSEQAFIAASDHPERAFTRLWTQKEAVLKAEGTGISSFDQLRSALDNPSYTLDTHESEGYIYTVAYK